MNEHKLCMASLDVESLFTNIPLEETIKNCVNDLFSNNFYCGKISRKDLYDLLKLAATESFLKTNFRSCNGLTSWSHNFEHLSLSL